MPSAKTKFVCAALSFRRLRGTSAYPPRLAVKADIPDRQFRAITGREQMQQSQCYSITSSARASSVEGTVRPSTFAVLGLTVSSILLAP